MGILSRNQARNLFEDTDINVAVTIFSVPLKEATCKSLWLNAIKETISAKSLSGSQVYTFQVTPVRGVGFTVHATVDSFLEELRKMFLCSSPTSIRIDVLEDSDCSWIIILKSDL